VVLKSMLQVLAGAGPAYSGMPLDFALTRPTQQSVMDK
jgi:hypothetical protein